MSYYLDSKYPFNPVNLQGSITTNEIKDTSVIWVASPAKLPVSIRELLSKMV